MTLTYRALVAAMVLTPIMATAWIRLADASSFELECGHGPSGVPTPIVVQLLDRGTPRHGSMVIRRKLQDASGEVDVELNIMAHRPMCGAMTPGQFRVRGSAALLSGKTLTVTTRTPVRVEVQNSMKQVLAFQVVDPAESGKITIGW